MDSYPGKKPGPPDRFFCRNVPEYSGESACIDFLVSVRNGLRVKAATDFPKTKGDDGMCSILRSCDLTVITHGLVQTSVHL